jgi:peptidyl-prolyl cis-trans isomerase B (cyclophilin B)
VPFPVVLDYLPEIITFHTNCGDIVIKTVGSAAPLTLSVFADLITNGYFDQTICHRLTTSGLYVIQCGDPTATGGGKTPFNYRDENLPASATNNYPAGTVAMANSGPSTNGSQFFLTYANTTLAPSYTIWGHITDGLNILQTVAKAGVAGGGSDGTPAQKLAILSASVTGGSYSDASLLSFMINGFNVLATQSALTLPTTTVNASVTVRTNQPGAKAVISGDKNLSSGKNVVTVKVTAEDGVTTQSYSSIVFLADATPTPSPVPSISPAPLPTLSPAPVIKHSPTPTPTAKTLTWVCVKGTSRIKYSGKVITCPKGYKKA